VRGDSILKAITEARDAKDSRVGSRALLEEFGDDPEAVKAHVIEAKSALKKALPDGLGKVLLESRGPDGRKLAYNVEFLRWASQLGARPQVTKGRTSVTEDLKAEAAGIDADMYEDARSLDMPYKGNPNVTVPAGLRSQESSTRRAPLKPA